jgi:hypothetical protein
MKLVMRENGTAGLWRFALSKNISTRRPLNRRSLGFAPPDFQLRMVALINCVRLSLRRVAYVVVSSSCDVGNPGRRL